MKTVKFFMLKSYIVKTIKISLIFFFFILFFRAFILEPSKVNGASMEPNFVDSEIFLVNKFPLLFDKPRRGQVVQLLIPEIDEVVIKRIIGLPGEQITIKQNAVFVTDTDGQTSKLDEPYLATGIVTDSKDGQAYTSPILKKNQYFLLGDNRGGSSDSRHYGAISREHIFGSVIKIGK